MRSVARNVVGLKIRQVNLAAELQRREWTFLRFSKSPADEKVLLVRYSHHEDSARM